MIKSPLKEQQPGRRFDEKEVRPPSLRTIPVFKASCHRLLSIMAGEGISEGCTFAVETEAEYHAAAVIGKR